VGNLTWTTDRIGPNGRKREFTYDALDRVTKETWRLGTTGPPFIRSMTRTIRRAAEHGQRTSRRADGNAAHRVRFGYDNLDRVTSVTDTANSAANSQLPNTLTAVPGRADSQLPHAGRSEPNVRDGSMAWPTSTTRTSTTFWAG